MSTSPSGASVQVNSKGDSMDKKVLDVAGCGLAMLGIIPLGIWFFLLYRILVAVDATTAMWAAYWIYAPIGVYNAFLLPPFDRGQPTLFHPGDNTSSEVVTANFALLGTGWFLGGTSAIASILSPRCPA